jgi:hypothetical protein
MFAHLIEKIKKDKQAYKIMDYEECDIHGFCWEQHIFYTPHSCVHLKNVKNDERFLYDNEEIGLELCVFADKNRCIVEIIKDNQIVFEIN